MARRRLVQAAVIAALVVGTATALVLTARPDPAAWTGGLVTPPHVTLDPSDAPDGAAVATGVVVDGQELVLFLSTFGRSRQDPLLAQVWRDTRTGRISWEDPVYHAGVGSGLGEASESPVFQLGEYVSDDGGVYDFGAVRGPAARIVAELGGHRTEAKFARWSTDPSVSIFWLRRPGPPIPVNTRIDEAHWVPLAPQWYPLFSAYDGSGHLIGSARLRPAGTELKGG